MSHQSASTARESSEELYIKTCGEKGVSTVVETWLDVSCPLDPRDELGNLIPGMVERRAALQAKLEGVLTGYLTELERAEWASMLCGGSDYQSWLADQE